MKTILIILVVAALGLCLGLAFREKNLASQFQAAQAQNTSLSNRVEEAQRKLDESGVVAAALQQTLEQRNGQLGATSNDLVKLNVEFAKIQADFKAAQDQLKQRDVELADFKSKTQDSASKMEELETAFDKLETQITETKQKLASAEGDREFLLAQLKKLETEKADLVKRWNNLAALREQYVLLKEQSMVTKRMEWSRKGLYRADGAKGAERLMSRPPAVAAVATGEQLVTEMDEAGTARVVPAKPSAPASK